MHGCPGRVPASAAPCRNSALAVSDQLFGIDSHDRLMLTFCQPTKRLEPTWMVTSSGLEPREAVIVCRSASEVCAGAAASRGARMTTAQFGSAAVLRT